MRHPNVVHFLGVGDLRLFLKREGALKTTFKGQQVGFLAGITRSAQWSSEKIFYLTKDGDSCSKKRGIDEPLMCWLQMIMYHYLKFRYTHSLRQTSSKAKEIYNSAICCQPILRRCLRKCAYTWNSSDETTSATGFGPSTQMLRNTKRNCHTVSANSLSDRYPPNILQRRYVSELKNNLLARTTVYRMLLRILRRMTCTQRLLAHVSSFHAEDTCYWLGVLTDFYQIACWDIRLNKGTGLTYSLKATRKIAKLAHSCLRKNPDDRPAMSRIVDVLREAIRESKNENNSQFGSRLPEPSAHRMVHAA
ncbi:hypothetical protein Tco_0986587 [Tanacetum coccineum]